MDRRSTPQDEERQLLEKRLAEVSALASWHETQRQPLITERNELIVKLTGPPYNSTTRHLERFAQLTSQAIWTIGKAGRKNVEEA